MGRMRAPTTEHVTIGRDADLQVLDEALSAARAGSSRCVVVGGEAGMGKTRLLSDFRSSLAEDTVVLAAECIDLGPLGVPFGPIRTILRQLVAVVGAEELLAAAGPGRPAIAALLPELAKGAATGEEPLHETIVDLLRIISRDRPIVLLLDDAQWVDAATLAVLRYVLRTVSDDRVMVVLSYRTEDTGRGHPLRQVLAELDQARAVTRRELRGLEEAEIIALVTRLWGSEPERDIVARIAVRSQGVPFFIEELVGLGSDGIPDSLRDVLLARYLHLDPAAQSMLRALAVGGMQVSHDVLREIWDGNNIDAAVRAAADAVLVVPAEDGYSFRHALVREAVRDELLPGEGRRLHRRYAEVLSAAGAAASETSYHWLAAGELARALSASIEAFDETVAGRAYESALQLGERALDLWDRVPGAEECAGRTRATLLAQVVTAAIAGGDRKSGLAWVTEAIAAVDPLDRRARVELLRAQAAMLSDEGLPGAESVLREALTTLGDEDTEDDDSELVLRARVQLSLSGRYELTGRMEEARALLPLAFDAAMRSGDRAAISCALQWMCGLALEDGDIDRGRALLDEAFAYADDGVPLLLWATNATASLYDLGDYGAALEVCAWPFRRARELGLERSWAVLLSGSSAALFALGRWEEAAAIGDQVLAMQPAAGSAVVQHWQRIAMADWRDDTAAASAIARDHRELLDAFAARGDLQEVLPAAAALGELALFRGELDEAWRRVVVLWEPVHRGATANDMLVAALAARIVGEFRRAGREIPAGAVENIAAVFERAPSWPLVSRWWALVDAELSGSRSADEEAAAWAAAAESLEDESMPAHLRAYAWWRRGQAELAIGDRVAATQSLRTAEEDADRIGALWVSRRARELQSTAGLGERSRGHQDRLTARELQVLDLVAEGLTNREISQRLFISSKTTSTHVSAILRKLGATTRTQAAGMVERPRA